MSDSYQSIIEPSETTRTVKDGGVIERAAPPKPKYLQVGSNMVSNKLYIATDTVTTSNSAHKEFAVLAAQWKERASKYSLTSQQISDKTFLKIVAMGRHALPLIFEEFRALPIPGWIMALEAIVGHDEGEGATSYRDAVKRWLQWADNNGY